MPNDFKEISRKKGKNADNYNIIYQYLLAFLKEA